MIIFRRPFSCRSRFFAGSCRCICFISATRPMNFLQQLSASLGSFVPSAACDRRRFCPLLLSTWHWLLRPEKALRKIRNEYTEISINSRNNTRSIEQYIAFRWLQLIFEICSNNITERSKHKQLFSFVIMFCNAAGSRASDKMEFSVLCKRTRSSNRQKCHQEKRKRFDADMIRTANLSFIKRAFFHCSTGPSCLWSWWSSIWRVWLQREISCELTSERLLIAAGWEIFPTSFPKCEKLFWNNHTSNLAELPNRLLSFRIRKKIHRFSLWISRNGSM